MFNNILFSKRVVHVTSPLSVRILITTVSEGQEVFLP